ncbi:MAG: hypothetical protein M3299_10375 [Thermoproteota archaeon]|nr:hypothetical protein [Thermoproteota archaeon]
MKVWTVMILAILAIFAVSRTFTQREQQKDPLYNSDIGTKKVFLTEEIFDLLSLTSHIQQGQDAGFEIAAMAR